MGRKTAAAPSNAITVNVLWNSQAVSALLPGST